MKRQTLRRGLTGGISLPAADEAEAVGAGIHERILTNRSESNSAGSRGTSTASRAYPPCEITGAPARRAGRLFPQ